MEGGTESLIFTLKAPTWSVFVADNIFIIFYSFSGKNKG